MVILTPGIVFTAAICLLIFASKTQTPLALRFAANFKILTPFDIATPRHTI